MLDRNLDAQLANGLIKVFLGLVAGGGSSAQQDDLGRVLPQMPPELLENAVLNRPRHLVARGYPAHKHDVAITPLAIPMLAGPGAITAVILLSNKAETFAHHVILATAITLVSAMTFLIFWAVASRAHMISGIALKITGRLMGLVLTAIAVQFILNGVLAARLFN